ncbi:CD8A protein, partial [Brachypteracias leptosomus]|nr:CD8A protein [Brachypteracias leptosomus]
MTRSPALLLFLTLGLCEYGHRAYKMSVKFRDSSTSHLQEGQRLELECLSGKEDSGVFWIRLDKGGTLHFIAFITSLSKLTFEGSMKTSTRFEARRDGRFYRLTVKSFRPQDEGNYFCLMISNQVLYFSPGQPAFFSGQQYLHPTSLSSAKIPSTFCSGPFLFSTPAETSKEKQLNFFCDIVIWVPLAGASLLLLIALTVTITLCQQTRRRRCRCKR